MTTTTTQPATHRLAITGEGLYLLNLLFPIISMLLLTGIYLRHRKHKEALVRNHLRQAFTAALITTAIFLAANILILLLGGYYSIYALIIFEVYFIVVVPISLIPGLLGLIKAIAGEKYYFPLIGGSHEQL